MQICLFVSVPLRLLLSRRDAANLSVFCVISTYSNGAVQILVGLELTDMYHHHKRYFKGVVCELSVPKRTAKSKTERERERYIYV